MTTHKEHPPAEAEGRQDQPGGRSGHSLPARSDSAGDLARAADVYARAGWPVFPCKPGTKVPITSHGFKDASAAPERVRAWWERNPLANIGAPTGLAFDVLDVDVRADGNGWGALSRLKRVGLLRGCIAEASTRNGGQHLFYPASGRGCGRGVAPRLDFKGVGGYVILAPSRVPADDGVDGPGCYQWQEFGREADGTPFDFDRAKALLSPPETKPKPGRSIRNIRRTPQAGVEGLVGWLGTQPEGNRNEALNWAAWRASEAGQLTDANAADLIAAAVELGLSQPEAESTINSVRAAA